MAGTEERGLRPRSERDSSLSPCISRSQVNLKVWPFQVVLVVQGRQRNVQKSVMQVLSCCFAHKIYCVF